jgi:hypothetical protein
MKDSPVTVRYLASPHEAFEATLSAINACGYYVINQDETRGIVTLQRGGSGTTAPGPLFSFLSAIGLGISFERFVMEIQLSPAGAEVDITGIPPEYDKGEFREITGRVFHRLNAILGEGKLVEGHLEKPGIVNELKKVLWVLAIFLIALVALLAIGAVFGGILLGLDLLQHR